MNIFGLLPSEIKEQIAPHFPAYRYKQLMHWLYGKYCFEPEMMSDLPKDFKAWLKESFSFSLPQVEEILKGSDGSSKYLLKLEDGKLIEMVLMPLDKKLTLCVSSQVGCRRKCSFCATGRMGLKRKLEVHEIVGQILLAAAESQPRRLTNIVLMGMGEPLDNFDNVAKALQIIQAEESLSFSPRRTTLSTCGIADGIIRLADSGIKCKLAVSLNSAKADTRTQLMPINRRYPLPVLKAALIHYLSKSSFRVTFEYILIPEVNMGLSDIKALQKYVGDLSCKINFIPFNPVPQLPYRQPTEAEIESFMANAQLIKQAITLRRSRGTDISGACGQLAGKHNTHKE